MDHPQVSVVMAVHNAEDTLKESLASVLRQTFTNFEFIIIDDGSSAVSYTHLTLPTNREV